MMAFPGEKYCFASVPQTPPNIQRQLEHFQFETRSVSNHTACRFAEKTRFFRSLFADGAVPPPRVLPFPKVKRSGLRTHHQIFVSRHTPHHRHKKISLHVTKDIHRYPSDTVRGFWGGWGSLRGKEPLFAASSDPTGGRRPCPLGDAGALRTSTAEQRGSFPLKTKRKEP